VPRYKLTIEYDGAPFAGWQIQADRPTVQGVLTAAIEALSGEKTLVQGAGRTDAGVHARGQVAHVDLAKEWDTDTVRDALNAHLRPNPVAILSAERVADGFNARTSAVKRHYLYRIVNRRADLTLDRAANGALIRHMMHDKKAKDGKLTFILARGIGQSFIARDVPEANVTAFLQKELRVG